MDLYTAAKEQNYKIIEKIKKNYYMNTGLYGACETGSLEIVKYFIEKEGSFIYCFHFI